jgi:hypothetical protein
MGDKENSVTTRRGYKQKLIFENQIKLGKKLDLFKWRKNLCLYLELSNDYLTIIRDRYEYFDELVTHFIEKLSNLRQRRRGFREENINTQLEELGFSSYVVDEFLEQIGNFSSEELIVNIGVDLLRFLTIPPKHHQSYPFSAPTESHFTPNPDVHRNKWRSENLTLYNVSYTSWGGDADTLSIHVQDILKDRYGGDEELYYYYPSTHYNSRFIIRLGIFRTHGMPAQADFSNNDGSYLFEDCNKAVKWTIKRYGNTRLGQYGCILVFKKSHIDNTCDKYHGIEFYCSNTNGLQSRKSPLTLLNIEQWRRYVRFCRSDQGDIDQGGIWEEDEEVEKWFESDYIIGPRSQNIAKWEAEGYAQRDLVPDGSCILLCIKNEELGEDLLQELIHVFYFGDEKM